MASTPTAHIWAVKDAEGRAYALKTLRGAPTPEALAAPRLLRAWNGRGAVRLVASTPRSTVMTWLPGPSAGDVSCAGGDGDRILADAIQALPPVGRPAVAPVWDLRRTCQALLKLPLPGRLRGSDRAPMARAQRLCRSLLLGRVPHRVLHGDIHHDNILLGPNGWRIIDPMPTFGDPAYDFSNVFRNPTGVHGLWDPILLRHRAALGARALHVPTARILAWGAVRAALSIAWSLEDGEPAPRNDLRILRALLALCPLPHAPHLPT